MTAAATERLRVANSCYNSKVGHMSAVQETAKTVCGSTCQQSHAVSEWRARRSFGKLIWIHKHKAAQSVMFRLMLLAA
jgi:hypothetical protein